MTGRTIGIFSVFDELAAVVIFVAVEALVMWNRIQVTIAMAFAAIHGFVFSFQRKICTVVIDIGQVVDLVKGSFVVTLGAILPELVVVYILVAFCTACMCNPAENLELFAVPLCNFVAFHAVGFGMLTPKFKIRICMAEAGRRAEVLVAVAIHAGCGQRALVIIVVAVEAARLQAQPGKIFLQ